MKQKGFTVIGMLVITAIGLLFLVVAVVIYQSNVKRVPVATENSQVDPSVIDSNPTLEEEPKDYSTLENQVKEAMQKYIENNEYNKDEVLITYTTNLLIEENYLEKLVDPNDDTIECHGYGQYEVEKNKYSGYVRCPGIYASEGYNPEFE